MNKRPFCTVFQCGRPADFQIGLSFLCAEHALMLGYIDNNGTMLDPRVVNLHQTDPIREALANLVELHDEQPSQLTDEDWERARKALKQTKG